MKKRYLNYLMTTLNFGIPIWFSVECHLASSNDKGPTLSDYAEFSNGLSKIFSGCVLIFSIIKIEREIKRKQVRINTANLMCHATAFILFTLVSLASSIFFFINDTPKKVHEELIVWIKGVFYEVSQIILLVILWKLGTKEPV